MLSLTETWRVSVEDTILLSTANSLHTLRMLTDLCRLEVRVHNYILKVLKYN